MSDKEALHQALAILAAIMQMSDECEKLGGCVTLAGIASAHKMQTSIQKNGPRLAKLAKHLLTDAA